MGAFFCVGVSRLSAEPRPPQEKNLLIIQTDEHNFRTLGCYRKTLPDALAMAWGKEAVVETPSLDSIAASGAICTSYYATSPVCTPSRASFFTGFYPQNTGSPQNDRPMKSEMVTFAEVLRRRGFATGYAGKWHLDGTGKPQWQPKRQFGFSDNRYMFNRGHWKNFELTQDGPRVGARNKKGQPTYSLNQADEESFSTDWLTDRCIDFIHEHASESFCYHLSLPDPHGPNTVRAPYDAMFKDLPIRAPRTFSMIDSNPQWGSAKGKNGVRRFSASQMALYFGMVRCIDDNVGKILRALERHDLREDTIIVFTSDHGDLCYEHGRLNKGNPYEGSAKIPFLLSAPGIVPPGTVIRDALGTVDFLPTVLSLMQLESPPGVQGRDASALFLGKRPAEWEDVAILRAASETPSWVAAVTDRYKLVYSVSEVPWLIDLEEDPDELENRFDRPENQNVIGRLKEYLIQYGKQNNDPQIHAKLIPR